MEKVSEILSIVLFLKRFLLFVKYHYEESVGDIVHSVIFETIFKMITGSLWGNFLIFAHSVFVKWIFVICEMVCKIDLWGIFLCFLLFVKCEGGGCFHFVIRTVENGKGSMFFPNLF